MDQPRSNPKGPDGNRSRDNAGNITPQNEGKFLELADSALELKKPISKKKRAAATAATNQSHETQKTEPYMS
jgi:hypothetical protein